MFYEHCDYEAVNDGRYVYGCMSKNSEKIIRSVSYSLQLLVDCVRVTRCVRVIIVLELLVVLELSLC